jgi:hypothetical protein
MAAKSAQWTVDLMVAIKVDNWDAMMVDRMAVWRVAY